MESRQQQWFSLMEQAFSLDKVGRYREAITKGETALKLAEHLSPKDLNTTLNNLASFYRHQGLYDHAEPLFLRCLDIRERALGQDDLSVAITLNNLAGLYEDQGLYDRAEPLYLRSLDIREQVLGKDHSKVATALNNLAGLYKSQGLYDRAEPLYLRSLDIKDTLLGEDHPDAAVTLNNLADLYRSQGLYDRAEPLYLRSLDINEQVLGKDHPYVANTLNNLASLYNDQGLYDRAEPLYLRCLDIYECALGEDHPDVANTLNNLALLYNDQGLYDRAEPLYLRCLDIYECALGEDHPDVANTLNNLALLYNRQGLYDRAESFYLRCLDITERWLGEDHPDVAITLNNLAELYRDQELYERAEPFYLRCLDIKERALGKDHPSMAATLNNLAQLYKNQELYERAEPFYLRCLDINERALGQNHPKMATTLNNLAGLYRIQGLYDRALEHYQTALNRQYNFIHDRLAHISESEHKLYLKDIKWTLESLLSLTYQRLNTSQSALSIALDAVLLTKNLSAAALAARNAIVHSGDPELQNQLHRIRELIARSNSLEYNDPQQPQLRNEIRSIELEIARIAPEVMLPDALQVNRQAIALKLPAGSCLVEFISFDVYNSVRYVAFIYAPDSTDHIRMVDLGFATGIDEGIDTCRKSIQNIYNSVETAGSCAPDEIEEFPLESLAPIKTRIIDPLHLNGVTHAIIAPDGALSFLPFQLFLPDCLVSYVSTGRDLVRVAGQKPAGASLVIADPDFTNQPTELHLVPSQPQIESDRVLVAGVKDLNNWRQLTSFGILGKAIASKLKVPYYKQQFATKARLTQSPCPHILSILTHGFALPKTDADELDPMARSGLAFCGANHGAEYLLLANEVATLDLHNNELTLLVACQTALGDVAAGEGVYGLRRAFTLAGAKTLVATLWEIPVYASVILIERFIDNLERYMGKAAALKEAQLYLRDLTVAQIDLIPAGKNGTSRTTWHQLRSR